MDIQIRQLARWFVVVIALALIIAGLARQNYGAVGMGVVVILAGAIGSQETPTGTRISCDHHPRTHHCRTRDSKIRRGSRRCGRHWGCVDRPSKAEAASNLGC
jgi:hypothetical protein